MKKMFFILFITTLPLLCYSQTLKVLPKVEIPKMNPPEVKIPLVSQNKIFNIEKNTKYYILVKKPDSTKLYSMLVKKPLENLEKILIAKPK